MALLNFLAIGRRLTQVAGAILAAVVAATTLATHIAKDWAGEVVYFAPLDRFAVGELCNIGNVL